MQALTVTGNTEITTSQIGPDLFAEYVAWVDRTPRTTRTYTVNLRQFFAWMLYEGIRQPQRADVIRFREWLQSEHEAICLDPDAPDGWKYRTDNAGRVIIVKCSANTVKSYLQSVRGFFKWAASENLYPDIASNIHAPSVDTSTHRKEALNVGEVQAIEKAITDTAAEKAEAAAGSVKDTCGRMQRADEQGRRMYAIYLLAVNAGLRTIEISRANVKDFTTRDGQSWIYITGKGHAEADAKKALAPEVAEAITDYLRSRKDNPVGTSPLFVSTGNRSGGKRIATTTISTMLKKAMQDAGINDERITAHSLRHTAGNSVMELTGDNVYVAQAYMRHRDPRTTEIYLHRDTEKADTQTAARLYNFYHGKADEDNLEEMIKDLTPQQRRQLVEIVKAMKGM